MRSGNADQSQQAVTDSLGGRLPCAGPSYLERLGILYLDEIRLTIVMELFMREMGVQQFYETFGGSSKDSIRRHFKKLVDYGWLRWVRDAPTGQKGRRERLYRATEQAVIDTDSTLTKPHNSSHVPGTINVVASVRCIGARYSGLPEPNSTAVAKKLPIQVPSSTHLLEKAGLRRSRLQM